MDDFWDEFDAEAEPTAAPKSNREKDPRVTESAFALLAVLKLMAHGGSDPHDGSPRSVAFDQIRPRLLLTLGQFTASLVLPSGSEDPPGSASNRMLIEETERWLDLALEGAPFDVQILHSVAMVLYDLHEVKGREDKKAKRIEQACDFLGKAARLAPGRCDILMDLGTLLSLQAETAPPTERTALVREAVDRFDEATRCFSPATRRVPETGKLHPTYRQAIASAGTLRYQLAGESSGEESSELFRQAYRQFTQADLDLPYFRASRGLAALELGWLPGRPNARRKLFKEACRYLEAAVEHRDPGVAGNYAHWGCATVGRAAVATHDEDAQRQVERAVELFERATQEAKGDDGVERIAAKAWLLLAAESSAPKEQEAARRAADAARRCNRMAPGSGDYNLACALSRQGKPVEASKALLAALARDPEDAAHALRDPDLERLWKARPKLRQVIAARPG